MHISSELEKSPVDGADYSGLQVDSRPKPQESPYGFRWEDEKVQPYLGKEKLGQNGVVTTVHAGPGGPMSPETAYAYGSSTISPYTYDGRRTFDDLKRYTQTPTPVKDRNRRICGLSRFAFWTLLLIIVLLLVGGAVVGGIFGGMKARQNSSSGSSSPPAQAPAKPSFPEAQAGDVMIGSPLCVISYDLGGEDDPAKRQEYRLYYQSLLGNIKEAISSGSTSWKSAVPIFTDALNNTGLASLTYQNGTQQQGSIFYVGTNGLLQEKRKIYSDSQYWQPGKINDENIAMVGNISLPTQGNDPQDSWHSYAMTAVYSRNFSGGAGARLFYHAQQTDGSSFVQEMIWTQNNDSWREGAVINGAYPNSHLAATIDDDNNVLRLFYSSGNNTLQAQYMSMSDTKGSYKKDFRLDNFLNSNSADLSAVSANGTTYLYHYAGPKSASANINNGANTAGIRELAISGNPVPNPKSSNGNSNNPSGQTFNMTEPLVTSPAYPPGTNSSLYQPLAAGKSVVPGLRNQLLVMWADKPTGDPGTNTTGYVELGQLSRTVANATWPNTGILQIPLGSDNSQPH